MKEEQIKIIIERTTELATRQTIALEKIARCLSAIEECLLIVVNTEDKSLQMKDIERAKVYSSHLGKKLRNK